MAKFRFTFKANYVNVTLNFVNCSVFSPMENLSSFVRALTGKPSALACWGVASVFLALSDPFDMSDTVGLLGRLIYWVVVIGAALQLATCMHLVFPVLHARFGAIVTRLIFGAIFAVTFGPFIFGFNAAFYPDRYATMMPWPQLLAFLFLIFGAIGIVMDAVSYQFTGKLAGERDLKTSAPEAGIAAVEEVEVRVPAFMERLDPKLGVDLIRLSMQDHYVEVHTRDGSQLILMRLADAIDELVGLDGLRVHRSHWVALSHVEDVSKEHGRLGLRTTDGAVVPVSRSYRADVKSAGLLG